MTKYQLNRTKTTKYILLTTYCLIGPKYQQNKTKLFFDMADIFQKRAFQKKVLVSRRCKYPIYPTKARLHERFPQRRWEAEQSAPLV